MAEPMAPGLSPEQGPPLYVPLSFFAAGSVALAAAGLLLAARGAAALSLRVLPDTLALVHLFTLGVLGMVMVGALYQMIPVVGGRPLAGVRIAPLVLVGLALGTTGLVVGFLTGRPGWLAFGGAAAVVTLVGFAAIASAALVGGAKIDTIAGVRIAVGGVLATALLGGWLVLLRLGALTSLHQARGLLGHVGLGLGVWIGGLVAAVSWQVVPMFFLTPPIPSRARRATLALTSLAVILGALAPALPGRTPAVAAALALGAAVGLVNPFVVLRALRARRRKRVGASVHYFVAAMGLAALGAVALAANVALAHPRLELALGWVWIVGFATTLVLGMLTRIVPFLVWFHRCSARPDAPSMRELLPERGVEIGLWVHLTAVALGGLAIGLGSDGFARAAGVALVGSAIAMASSIGRPLRRASAQPPQRGPSASS